MNTALQKKAHQYCDASGNMSDADSTQLESRGSGPAQILNKQKGPFRGLFLVGGEGGVRTHVGLTPPTDFESKIKYSNLILINMLRPPFDSCSEYTWPSRGNPSFNYESILTFKEI
jgi:hypothetical protein